PAEVETTPSESTKTRRSRDRRPSGGRPRGAVYPRVVIDQAGKGLPGIDVGDVVDANPRRDLDATRSRCRDRRSRSSLEWRSGEYVVMPAHSSGATAASCASGWRMRST